MASAGVDLSNRFLVGTIAGTDRLVVADPPRDPVMSPEDALVLAAWLVRVAQPLTGVMFETIRTAVMNS